MVKMMVMVLLMWMMVSLALVMSTYARCQLWSFVLL